MNIQTVDRVRLQRIEAEGRISVGADHGRTRLRRLFQEGSAKIRLPRQEGDGLEAVLINTGGGLTGGDRLSWSAEAAVGATLTLTTQACEKVYRSGGGEAQVACRLRAGEGARLLWLPQETILFEDAALDRRMEVELAGDARLLLVEAVILGRKAMGEEVRRLRFRDRWRVRVDGTLVHADDLSFQGERRTFASPAALGAAGAIASVLVVGDDAEALLPAARNLLGDGDGASFWRVGGSGKLLARLTADDGLALRRLLVPLLELLAGEAALPRIWSS